MNPPSPWIGSTITAASCVAPTCLSSTEIARFAASAPESPSWNGYDSGAR